MEKALVNPNYLLFHLPSRSPHVSRGFRSHLPWSPVRSFYCRSQDTVSGLPGFLSCGAALRCGVAGVLLFGASIHVLVRLCWPCCSSVLVTCFDAWLSISVRCLRILLQFMFYVVCLYCVLDVALNFLPSSSQLVGCRCRLRFVVAVLAVFVSD